MKKKLWSLVVAGLMAVQGAWAASPSLLADGSGLSFEQYSGSQTVGLGQVNVSNTLFFIDEGIVNGYHSWFIFADSATPSTLSAVLQFDQTILQVYSSTADIAATTPVYGAAGVSYGTRGYTGLEGNDSVSWADTFMVLDLRLAGPGDHLRVLTAVPTAPVPEPASAA
ncbi:MAG: hypothetical protein WAQ05_25820, partial [Rubrivivax sp.]